MVEPLKLSPPEAALAVTQEILGGEHHRQDVAKALWGRRWKKHYNPQATGIAVLDSPFRSNQLVETVSQRLHLLTEANLIRSRRFSPAVPEVMMRLRFGLADGRMWSYTELADNLGTNPETIRLMQARSLRRLGHPNHSRVLMQIVDPVGYTKLQQDIEQMLSRIR